MDARTTTAALLLTALLAAAPAACAGSQATPEVTDANDDASLNDSCPTPWSGQLPIPFADCPGWDFAFGSVDINSAWVEETEADLVLTIEMKANDTYQGGLHPFGQVPEDFPLTEDWEYDYAWNFTVGSTAMGVGVHLAKDGVLSPAAPATTAIVRDGNKLDVTVPKAALGLHAGDLLTGTFVTAHGSDGTNTLDDRGPSENFGLDYAVKAGAAAAPSVIYATVSAPVLSIGHQFTAATTQVYQFNWTQGPARASVLLQGNATAGTAHVVLRDSAGVVLLDQALGAQPSSSEAKGAAGTWTATVTYTGFTGSLSVVAKAMQSTTTTTSGPPPTTSTEPTETTSEPPQTTTSGEGKGTPGFAAPMAVAALALLAVARRRLA